MAFLRFKSLRNFLPLCKSHYLNYPHELQVKERNCVILLLPAWHPHRPFFSRSVSRSEKTENEKGNEKPEEKQESALVSTHFEVTNEIKFYRDWRNNFTQMCFSDTKQPYGPPLAIILPYKHLDEAVLKRLIDFYGEKGFDVITVSLNRDQFLYPCVAGNAMNVITELLEYLNETHKHRPYVFHGFSIGIYLYGEIMAQLSEHYETYRTIANNVKGCLWDSPIDFLTVKQQVGKFYYPKNWMKRYMFNRAVRKHFKKHYYDSVVYWLRARENFCSPIIKVPNVFFMSYTDPISNPCTIQSAQSMLECNGVPIFQKTWWDSQHTRHLEKYCYEYIYGMILFLHLANFFPDDSGKYRNSVSTASLANLRLRKTARDNFC